MTKENDNRVFIKRVYYIYTQIRFWMSKLKLPLNILVAVTLM